MDVKVGDDLIMFGQNNYIRYLLQKVGLFYSLIILVPTLGKFLSILASDKGSYAYVVKSFYISIVGALQHVCIIRVYIQFVANKSSLYM